MRKKETQPDVIVSRAPHKSGVGEAWRVTRKGDTQTVVTSGTSVKALDRAVKALDRAMVRFDTALKRLADR